MCNQARKKKRNRNPHEIWPMYRTLIPPYFSIWLAAIWFPWPLHSRYEAMLTYIPEGRLTQIRVSLFPPKSCLRHLEKNETPGYKSHPLMREMSWSISPPSWHGWHFFFFFWFFRRFFPFWSSPRETSSQMLRQRREDCRSEEIFSKLRNLPMQGKKRKRTRTA